MKPNWATAKGFYHRPGAFTEAWPWVSPPCMSMEAFFPALTMMRDRIEPPYLRLGIIG